MTPPWRNPRLSVRLPGLVLLLAATWPGWAASVLSVEDNLEVLDAVFDGRRRLSPEVAAGMGGGPASLVAAGAPGGSVFGLGSKGVLDDLNPEPVEERVLRGLQDDDRIIAVAFAPGARMLAGRWDYGVIVWDAASRQSLRTLYGHDDEVWCAAFSPDGTRIVTGSADRTAIVWEAPESPLAFIPPGFPPSTAAALRLMRRSGDPPSGRMLLVLAKHRDIVRAVAFSRDGTLIVTGSDDRTAMIWDVISGKRLRTLKGHQGGVQAVAFSPDRKWLVTGGGDGAAIVWNVDSGKTVLTLQGHQEAVNSVAFRSDGKEIVTGSEDGAAMIWDVISGKRLRTLQGHQGGVRAVAFSPDGSRVATGNQDGDVVIWEASSGRREMVLVGHRAPVSSVAFSPSGTQVATSGADHAARIWRIPLPASETLKEIEERLKKDLSESAVPVQPGEGETEGETAEEVFGSGPKR